MLPVANHSFLGNYCPSGIVWQYPDLLVSLTSKYWRVTPLLGSAFGMTVLPLIQCCLWLLQQPVMTTSWHIRPRASRWRHCQPSRSLLWYSFYTLLPENNQQEEIMDLSATYLVIKEQTARGFGSFLVKSSVCLVHAEISTQRKSKSNWLQIHDLDGAITRMFYTTFSRGRAVFTGWTVRWKDQHPSAVMAIHPQLEIWDWISSGTRKKSGSKKVLSFIQVTGSGQHLVLPPPAPMEQSGEIWGMEISWPQCSARLHSLTPVSCPDCVWAMFVDLFWCYYLDRFHF